MSMRSAFGPFVFSIVAVLSGCGSDDGTATTPNGANSAGENGEGETTPANGSLILEAPKDQRADAGTTVTIAARVADGVKVEWLRDGQPIADASSASLLVSPAKLRDSARYTLKATAADGRTEEAHATLAVSGLEQLLGSQGGASFRDGPRLDARFAQPMGIARDPNGNVYVADRANHVIRRIATDGMVSVLAGSPGAVGGIDGQGAAARFNAPEGIAYGDGALFVADKNNHSIRKVLLDGTVTTLAGTSGFAGTADGPGASAQFKQPSGVVAIGSAVYVADSANYSIRKIDTVTGLVSTFAGVKGMSGELEGIPGAFDWPRQIAAGPTGKIYVSDNQRVAEITLSTGSVADVKAGGNKIEHAYGLAYDPASASLYLSGWRSLRRLAGGQITTIAGDAYESGNADGPGASARFWTTRSLALDADGALLVSDTDNGAIRRVAVTAPEVAVTTYAGKLRESAVIDGDSATARVSGIASLATDSAGFTYAIDDRALVIRRIAPDGTTTTFAGKAHESGLADGPPAQARFVRPQAIAFDPKGRLLIGDSCKLRFATMNGDIGSLGGQVGLCGGNGNGSLPSVLFNEIRSIVVTPDGMIYVASIDRIQRVAPSGYVTLLAGGYGAGGKDGTGKDAFFSALSAIAIGNDGALYGADGLTVRRITMAGEVTTIAGVATLPGHVDGTGAQARFASANTIAVDAKTGDLIVGDHDSATLRRVTTSGVVTTVAGRPGWASFQPGGLPGALVGPSAIASLPDGSFVAGTDARVVKIAF